MKHLIAVMLIAALSAPAHAARSASVKGHITKSGSYVPPHHRTVPNKTKADNYSTKGNVNPYTGKQGTR